MQSDSNQEATLNDIQFADGALRFWKCSLKNYSGTQIMVAKNLNVENFFTSPNLPISCLFILTARFFKNWVHSGNVYLLWRTSVFFLYLKLPIIFDSTIPWLSWSLDICPTFFWPYKNHIKSGSFSLRDPLYRNKTFFLPARTFESIPTLEEWNIDQFYSHACINTRETWTHGNQPNTFLMGLCVNNEFVKFLFKIFKTGYIQN